MILQTKKHRFLHVFFLLIGTIAFFQVSFSFVTLYFSKKQISAIQANRDAMTIIYELGESSDNLTKMAQVYVVTKDKKYRTYYNQIMAIRQGKMPRPSHYELFYWDTVPSTGPLPIQGTTIPFRDLMENQHFTSDEFDLLDQALNLSNDLSLIEETAMNALEGKFDDGSGTFPLSGPPNQAFAEKLLFDDSYWQAKLQIFLPIQEFAIHAIERTKNEVESLNKTMILLLTLSRVFSVIVFILMIVTVIKAIKSLSNANKSNELLLLNIFPSSIVNRLKGGEDTIADEYQASILFADIVHFTQSSSELGPVKIVKILNELFREFDDLTEKFGVEKVKTIGDCYMVAAGVPTPASDHVIRIAEFALEMRKALERFNQANRLNLTMRVGMNCGTVIAGVIGHKKFIYDVWGDVVNTASRMESTGIPGEIQITERMALILDDKFEVEERAEFEVKGKGVMKTFFLKKKKPIILDQP